MKQEISFEKINITIQVNDYKMGFSSDVFLFFSFFLFVFLFFFFSNL